MTAKINLLPVLPAAEELEAKLDLIETVRSSHEGNLFQQAFPHVCLACACKHTDLKAKLEMEGLTSIVANEAEVPFVQ
jgi:hypothetical protein